jgi:hypothetical protein
LALEPVEAGVEGGLLSKLELGVEAPVELEVGALSPPLDEVLEPVPVSPESLPLELEVPEPANPESLPLELEVPGVAKPFPPALELGVLGLEFDNPPPAALELAPFEEVGLVSVLAALLAGFEGVLNPPPAAVAGVALPG